MKKLNKILTVLSLTLMVVSLSAFAGGDGPSNSENPNNSCGQSDRLNAEIAVIKYLSEHYTQDGQLPKNEKISVIESLDWEIMDEIWYITKGFNMTGCDIIVTANCSVTVTSVCGW